MTKEKLKGVYQWALCQLNSSSTIVVQYRRVGEMSQLVDWYNVDGLSLREVGANWLTYPSSYKVVSWF